jgi:hypothetical protein
MRLCIFHMKFCLEGLPGIQQSTSIQNTEQITEKSPYFSMLVIYLFY